MKANKYCSAMNHLKFKDTLIEDTLKLLEENKDMENKEGKNIKWHPSLRRLPKVAIIILCIILASGTVATATYVILGAENFKGFFTKELLKNQMEKPGIMNLHQLQDMSVSTNGIVCETNELRFELLGLIKSEDTATIMLKITAKQLDSILYDGGIPVLKNYRFNDEGGSLAEISSQGRSRYIYSDEDDTLKENQCIYIASFISDDSLDDKEYSFSFTDFGYFTIGKKNSPGTDFPIIYEGTWEFNVAFDNAKNIGKNIDLHRTVNIEDLVMRMETVKMTPLFCIVNFSAKDNSQINTFIKHINDIEFKLKDGSILNSDYYSISGGGGFNYLEDDKAKYDITIDFLVPIDINQIEAISILGEDYSLKRYPLNVIKTN